MRVFVTGSSGFIGKETVEQLEAVGHTVIPYDIRDQQDIRNTDVLREAMHDADAVIHLAAIPHPDPHRQWEHYFSTNVAGTQNVAEVAADLGIKRLVYSSSTAYYGMQRGFPFSPGRGVGEGSLNGVQRYYGKEMPEMTPYNEACLAYVSSKVAAEAALAAYGYSQRLEVIILRLAPVLTSREPYEWGILLHVERAAAALVAALELPDQRWYEIYNVQNPDADTLNTSKWAKLILAH